MALIDRQLREVWDALRAKAPGPEALQAVRIRNLRGIQDLKVPFRYPVCVLAGPNGCGKSTVLFACACAYRDPDRKPRDLMPSTIFPNFINKQEQKISDVPVETELEFDYQHKGLSYTMVWKRGKSWNRSYKGRPGGEQPERKLYIRTLANLTNPAEVRSFLQLARKEFMIQNLPVESLMFAGRILPQRYQNLTLIKTQRRDLLFAQLDNQQSTGYSEFHMSAGERAVLRFSKDLSKLQGTLVLIDEIEAGLHPYTQQQVMLGLQRIALRQDLQVIVASHSTTVLDSVPPEGRIFLHRNADTDNVQMTTTPYKDILQRALYGQSHDRLSILCEDKISEAIVLGVLDAINPTLDPPLAPDALLVGRDTGSSEFAGHVRALGKFGRLADFLMVLDGDAQDKVQSITAAAEAYGYMAEPLVLPGATAPEQWIWSILQKHPQDYAGGLGVTLEELKRSLAEIEQIYQGHHHLQTNRIWKPALEALAERFRRTPETLARLSGRTETTAQRGAMLSFQTELLEKIQSWRARNQN